MARKVSRRKRPPKDEFQLKERMKIESEVFDRSTLLSLAKLISKGILKSVDWPVSTGKEANVFRGTASDGKNVAVKIYKVETTKFVKRKEYLEGDPRFGKFRGRERDLVFAFAQKEYKNLGICEKAGIAAPKPYYQHRNILVMEFLGMKGLPFPMLHDVGPAEGEFRQLIGEVRGLWKAGLVHADLSEYNILVGRKLYVIDWGQGVVSGHPKAEKYLRRDVENILDYFSKFIKVPDLETALAYIKGERKTL